MKVLVTGATGFIGREVLLALREAGHRTVVLTRDPERAPVRLPVHSEVFAWDPALLHPPREAFDGVEAVVHLAGESIVGRWTESRKSEILRSRVLSTHHLVETIQQLETKPRVLVSASGIGFYGNRQAVELDEAASPGDGFLAGVCRKWEEEAQRAEALGVRTVRLRIGVVLGRDGGALRMMLPAFRLGLGGPVGGGEQWLSWIHVRDLARLFVYAVEQDKLSGPVNAVAPQPVTQRDFAKTLGRVLRRPAVLHPPAFLLKMILGEAASVILHSLKVLPKKAGACGFEFGFPDLEAALRDIAYQVALEFRTEMWLPHSKEKVFGFFSDAANLEAITPPHLHFRIVYQNAPRIEQGTRINYRLKLHGVPFGWQSLITDWQPCDRFSDFQVMGPYWMWYHTHEFEDWDGGTLVRDRALYRLPFWVFGEVLGGPWVRRDLEKIFRYRQERLKEMLRE